MEIAAVLGAVAEALLLRVAVAGAVVVAARISVDAEGLYGQRL